MEVILLNIPAGVTGIVTFILGVCLTLIGVQVFSRIRRKNQLHQRDDIIAGAQREAENIIKTAKIDAAEERIKRKEQVNNEINQLKTELKDSELRLNKREDALDRLTETIQERERASKQQKKDIEVRLNEILAQEKKAASLVTEQKNLLLKITGMDNDQAKALLLKHLEEECEHEMSVFIQRKVEEANEVATEKSREIINSAIQRYAADQTCDVTVSTVEIPSDDMKGRIIGREGRNIRAFEKATGVDVIVDDTPGMIVVSGFSPIRREVARLSMERLIQDGRIHPSRIEEVVKVSVKDVNAKVAQIGKDAVVETNVRGLPQKVVHLLGSLNFRTSYGQNVLRHSVEVAFLAQIMAEELGLDGSIARRAGLLHDIGKALDHEIEGGHAEIGANFIRRFNEDKIIINCIEAHHGDVPADNPYAPLIAAADAISASRPGARRETLERYIKRLEKLEEIATGFKGINSAYAIQAGREIRVIANADEVDDDAAMKCAREIAKKIENEMTYPGEIQVTLLREVRCVEYAR